VDPRKIGRKDAINSGWYQQETGELLNGFKIKKEDTVLDVGCGKGMATLFCANQGAHVVFTDVKKEKIDLLKKTVLRTKARKIEAFVSDSMPLPIDDNYATKILAMEMLEHTEDPEAIVQELFRVGKPGAQYLITVPDKRSEILQKPFACNNYFSSPNHIQLFDKKRFLALMDAVGLVVEKHVTWGFFWVMWMSIFWALQEEEFEGEILDKIGPHNHVALQSWTNTWNEIMKIPNSQSMMKAFNQTLPKAQAVIARKPE
jgi:ubiquinone/menaquinone biosynthesis C-methylase UbiE